MSSKAGHRLDGLAVLVTRPAHQAAALAERLAALGAEPVLLPAMAIEPLPSHPGLLEALRSLPALDIAVFASANAVAFSWPAITAAGGLRAATRVAAIGPATTRALAEHGVAGVLVPDSGADSEALLARPELQAVTGRRIAIFCGEGGRTLLHDTLVARGASVIVAVCYRRVVPDAAPGTLEPLLARGGLHAVTFMSGETARNLYGMVSAKAAEALRRLPHVVNHENVAAAVRACGVTDVTVGGSTDEALVAALCERMGTTTTGAALP